jgi:hypothetical protein
MDENNGKMLDFVDSTQGYGSIGIENDTQGFGPEQSIMNSVHAGRFPGLNFTFYAIKKSQGS